MIQGKILNDHWIVSMMPGNVSHNRNTMYPVLNIVGMTLNFTLEGLFSFYGDLVIPASYCYTRRRGWGKNDDISENIRSQMQ